MHRISSSLLARNNKFVISMFLKIKRQIIDAKITLDLKSKISNHFQLLTLR